MALMTQICRWLGVLPYNIERSKIWRGEWAGYGRRGVWRIARQPDCWVARSIETDPETGFHSVCYAGTLKQLSAIIEVR